MRCGWSSADGWWSLQLPPGRRRGAAPARTGHENSSFFLQCIFTELQAWVCSALDWNKSLKCFCEMKTISKILLSDKNEPDFLLTFSAPWAQTPALGSCILLSKHLPFQNQTDLRGKLYAIRITPSCCTRTGCQEGFFWFKSNYARLFWILLLYKLTSPNLSLPQLLDLSTEEQLTPGYWMLIFY